MDILNSYTSLLGQPSDLANQFQAFSQAIIGLVILVGVIGTVITILYVYSLVRTWKMQEAILKLQKDVAEINERQKQTFVSSTDQSLRP